MRAFFRGITETVPSLFRGIFSERNSVPNPSHTERKVAKIRLFILISKNLHLIVVKSAPKNVCLKKRFLWDFGTYPVFQVAKRFLG
jgi:hypothetical protein